MTAYKILIVDDEEVIRFGIRDYLEYQGYEVLEAESCAQVLEVFQNSPPDATILDYSLPDGNTLELLPRLKSIYPYTPFIFLTAHGTIDLAVRAVKEGAEQFLTKPVEMQVLALVLQRALENQRNRRKQIIGRARQQRQVPDPFLGTSAAIRQMEEQARRVLSAQRPILLQGETGTGKGVLAAWLHRNGPRADEALVELNCAGLSRDFLETELFGHEKGAFTGAVNAKVGLLEVANRGMVFLDEIGDMDPHVQPKLLKVVEEKRFRRLGDVRERQVDICLVAATHRDLGRLAREDKFRSDLYFRISTITLRVPSLRERPEDIPRLAENLLRTFTAEMGRGEVHLSPDAERALREYLWPGNIRELRNVVERALLLHDVDVLTSREFTFDASARPATPPEEEDMSLAAAERRHIETVLRLSGGQVEQAARRLGTSRSALYQKIKNHGILLSKIPDSPS